MNAQPPTTRKIVVGLDFSEVSDHAFRHAADSVRETGGTLHVVTVVEAGALGDYAPTSACAKLFYDARARFKEQLLRLVDEYEDERAAAIASQVTLHCLVGHAAEGIVRVAAEQDADAIVVGSHGRGALARALIGSVSELVVRTAGCPVVVVRPKAHQRPMRRRDKRGELEDFRWAGPLSACSWPPGRPPEDAGGGR